MMTMRAIGLVFVWAITGLGFAGAAPIPKAAEPTTAEKLVGKWKLVKSDVTLQAEIEVFVEFTKDGKLVLSFNTQNSETLKRHGTFKAEGNKITYTVESGLGERSEVLTIKKLTEDELHVVDPDNKNEQFTRVKALPKKMDE
jgi:uncharacterized protein (TIGR03066 family)